MEGLILHGDAQAIPLRDESVELVLTDPPYGLGVVNDLPALLTAWISGEDASEHVGRGGFMSKDWDKICPPPSLWREVYRVLKPGGYLLCFAGTRTADLIGISIRLAGFELRDEFDVHGLRQSWLYGSGFPKSTAIGKAIDKAAGAEREVVGPRITGDGHIQNRQKGKNDFGTFEIAQDGIDMDTAPATPEAAEWEGFGTGLKPAHEVVLIFRKPLEKGLTVAENCLKWGTGAINVDAGRISCGKEHYRGFVRGTDNGVLADMRGQKDFQATDHPSGRFPSNVIFVHPACTRVGVRRVRGNWGFGKLGEKDSKGKPVNIYHNGVGGIITSRYADPDGLETVPQYACDEKCPVRELDLQSGVLTSGKMYPTKTGGGEIIKHAAAGFTTMETYGDTGTASRYFKQVEYTEPDFRYCAKESKAMRNAPIYFDGLLCEVIKNKAERNLTALKTLWNKAEHYASIANTHCTVKPVELLRYFIKLFSREGDTVLDPFAGSGSTLVACRLENRKCIGIEREWEYVQIANARDTYWANPEVRKAYELDGELPVQRAELPLFGED